MDIERARQLAKDETTTPEILRELANHEDRETRQSVAGNPNTPKEALLSICVEFPQEVINNLVVPLLILENPLIFTCDIELDFNQIKYLINKEINCLGWTREQKREYLSEIYDKGWIEYLRKEELIDFLSRLRALYKNHNSCPIALKIEKAIQLANDKVSELEILSQLENNPNHLTCKYILLNPNAPAEAIEKIYKTKHSWKFLFEIAKHPNTGSLTLKKFISEHRSNKKLLKIIASHPNTSPDTLKKLLNYCPLQVIKNNTIELILLEHPSFFGELTHLPKKFFDNKTIPSWFFEFAANHSHVNIRAEVAIGTKTPLYLLEKLSQDIELKVRNYVYWNKNTPKKIIEKLKIETIQYAPFNNY